ncbi:MAG: multiheme c-type cytochrome [Myxococcota bacterium]
MRSPASRVSYKRRQGNSQANHAAARASRLVLRLIGVAVLLFGGWAGCRCRATPPAAEPKIAPSLRLVLISSVAGALEPCGCVKDMLGGVNHAAAYLRAHATTPTLVLGAGPLLFADPTLSAERRSQDEWKAEALLHSLASMGLKAWSPGANDFAAGMPKLSELSQNGPQPLAANLRSNAGSLPANGVYQIGGVKVGVAGVSLPKYAGKLPDGLTAEEPLVALRTQAAELVRQGTSLRVALLSMPRGEAMRLAELVPDFQVVLVGKSADQGESNDLPSPPSRVGSTLVVESPNHLQSFYVVDLFVKDGRFVFENGDANAEKRQELNGQIHDLEARIAAAERASAQKADIDARRRDLDKLRAALQSLDKNAKPPAGSHYRVELVEVRERLGDDAEVQKRMLEYYRRVNDHNREAFRDKLPPPVTASQSSYVGVEACATCHKSEHEFWLKTGHSKAYATLSRQFKEFNLDCVSCHVTGYDQPGGSTVTHVDKLTDVQCEVCHGPGSRHLKDPTDAAFITAKPDLNLCAAKCHHPPHVKPDWNIAEALPHIVGKGHGG